MSVMTIFDMTINGLAWLGVRFDMMINCNIPDVTVTKTGSCHHEHCIAYLLSKLLCIKLKQVYFEFLCLGK